MKKIFLLSVFAFIIISSCNEIMPTIPPIGIPEILSERKILIEEFTGVGCVNCPRGSEEIESLLRRYPKNLVAISIHAGFFSKPYSSSKYDFRTEDADDLVGTYFGGEPFAYPSGTINREKTETNTFYITDQEWAGEIDEELKEEVQVLLDVHSEFDEASRTMSADVTIEPKTNIPNDARITIMITESGVVDYQLLPEGWKSDYVHKHMLREIVTPFDGEIISADGLTAGVEVTRSFSFVLPADWNAAACEVIAIVHRNTATSTEVLNVNEARI